MNKIFIFALGAAAGSLVTWKIVEEKYKKIADEEIESVIERFKEREKTSIRMDADGIELRFDDKPVTKISNETAKCAEVEIEEKTAYEKLVRDVYNADEEIDDDGLVINTTPAKEITEPYVISPEEFGEFGDENTKSWMYYSDFVLIDEDDQIVSDPESIIGDALSHFGEYEDDAVHVRNENIECDIEILKSEKTFSEVYKEDD